MSGFSEIEKNLNRAFAQIKGRALKVLAVEVEKILDSLGRLQREVLDVIKQHGPLSNEQIAEHLNKWPYTITPSA